MSGFIDLLAPDPSHEYSRFLDGDVLGKMLFKNFLINRVGIQPPDFYIPRGRHGDVESPETLPADARVTVDGLPLQFEIKAGRRTTANRHRGDTNEAYSFYGFLRTRDTKYDRSYDIAVAICVRVLEFEEPGYWQHLHSHSERLSKLGHTFEATTLPHEPDFLNICGFFIVPQSQIQTNQWRVTVSGNSSRNKYWGHFAWGHDTAACLQRWEQAVQTVKAD